MKNEDLGAAKTGFHDWYWQRISAGALLILLPALFILVALVYGNHIDFTTLNHWMTLPLTKALSTLTLAAILIHVWAGLKVIIEDYIHTSLMRAFILNLLLLLLFSAGAFMTYHIWAELASGLACTHCSEGGV